MSEGDLRGTARRHRLEAENEALKARIAALEAGPTTLQLRRNQSARRIDVVAARRAPGLESAVQVARALAGAAPRGGRESRRRGGAPRARGSVSEEARLRVRVASGAARCRHDVHKAIAAGDDE